MSFHKKLITWGEKSQIFAKDNIYFKNLALNKINFMYKALQEHNFHSFSLENDFSPEEILFYILK